MPGLPLEDCPLLIATYWRTSLALRQLAPLCGMPQLKADSIMGNLAHPLTLRQREL